MGKLWNYFVGGLKVWVIGIVASLVFWLFSALFGVSALALLNGGFSGVSVFLLIAYIVCAVPIAILLSGFIAKKFWRWS